MTHSEREGSFLVKPTALSQEQAITVQVAISSIAKAFAWLPRDFDQFGHEIAEYNWELAQRLSGTVDPRESKWLQNAAVTTLRLTGDPLAALNQLEEARRIGETFDRQTFYGVRGLILEFSEAGQGNFALSLLKQNVSPPEINPLFSPTIDNLTNNLLFRRQIEVAEELIHWLTQQAPSVRKEAATVIYKTVAYLFRNGETARAKKLIQILEDLSLEVPFAFSQCAQFSARTDPQLAKDLAMKAFNMLIKPAHLDTQPAAYIRADWLFDIARILTEVDAFEEAQKVVAFMRTDPEISPENQEESARPSFGDNFNTCLRQGKIQEAALLLANLFGYRSDLAAQLIQRAVELHWNETSEGKAQLVNWYENAISSFLTDVAARTPGGSDGWSVDSIINVIPHYIAALENEDNEVAIRNRIFALASRYKPWLKDSLLVSAAESIADCATIILTDSPQALQRIRKKTGSIKTDRIFHREFTDQDYEERINRACLIGLAHAYPTEKVLQACLSSRGPFFLINQAPHLVANMRFQSTYRVAINLLRKKLSRLRLNQQIAARVNLVWEFIEADDQEEMQEEMRQLSLFVTNAPTPDEQLRCLVTIGRFLQQRSFASKRKAIRGI